MNPRFVSVRRRIHRAGVGLAELLVALAISAALLTSVAVALDASFKSYAANQEQSQLTQRARLALNRVLTTIRTTSAHAPVTSSVLSSFATGQTVNDTGIAMIDPTGTAVRYLYDAAAGQVLYRRGTTTRVLLEGVRGFSVRFEPMRSAESIKTGGGYDLVARATITLTLGNATDTAAAGESTGDQTVTLSSSVMPRKNVW